MDEETINGPDQAPQEGDQGDTKTFDAAYVKKLRNEAASWRAKAQENASAAHELAQIKEAQKSEADKTAEKLADAVAKANQAEAQLLRYEIAIEKNVPLTALRFMTGTTRDDIEESADLVLQLLHDAAKPRSPQPDPNQGQAPLAGGTPQDQFVAWANRR